MSKFTTYIAQVQDLNPTQAAIYNALKDNSFGFKGEGKKFVETSICWPSRKRIQSITKIKKLQTISDNIKVLIDLGHVICIGPIYKNNEISSKMYWVNNGENDIYDDLAAFADRIKKENDKFNRTSMTSTIDKFRTYNDDAKITHKGGVDKEGVVPLKGTRSYPQKVLGSTLKRYEVVPLKGTVNINILPTDSQSISNEGAEENMNEEIEQIPTANTRSPKDWNESDPYLATARQIHGLEEEARANEVPGYGYIDEMPLNGITVSLRKNFPGHPKDSLQRVLDDYTRALKGHIHSHSHPKGTFPRSSNFNGFKWWAHHTSRQTEKFLSVEEWDKIKQAPKQQGYVAPAVHSQGHDVWSPESQAQREAEVAANHERIRKEMAGQRSVNVPIEQNRGNGKPRAIGDVLSGNPIT